MPFMRFRLKPHESPTVWCHLLAEMRVGAANTFAHPFDRSDGAELTAISVAVLFRRKSVSAFDEPIGFVRKRLSRGYIAFLRENRRPRLRP